MQLARWYEIKKFKQIVESTKNRNIPRPPITNASTPNTVGASFGVFKTNLPASDWNTIREQVRNDVIGQKLKGYDDQGRNDGDTDEED
ncbi:hypothetical protein ABH897_002533 [Paenibacillus sp. RC73]|uniref:hypothetical protein n=1 Tax=Paenibacillus sp. RC73 TaxID=3156250 RepID=UPI003838B64D